MKKTLSLALFLALCLGLTVPTLAAGQPGDTTVANNYGTISFSNPIQYTLSRSDLQKVDMTSMNVSIEGEDYDTDFFGPFSDYLDAVFWSKITTVYAVPSGTSINFSDGILISDLVNFDTEWKNGVCRATDFEVVLLSGYDSIKLSGSGFILIDLSRTAVEETSTFDGSVGISGSAIGDNDAGSICIFIAEDSQKTNPFAASTPNTPSTPTVPNKPSFTDVKADAYYADSVAWAVEKNITSGTSKTTFSPNATCTQGQILTFLWRAKGEPKPTGAVSGAQYYATAAQWAKEQGLTDDFSAEADCTRAMVVTYLWKLAGSPAASGSRFTDVPAGADYAQAVAWAVQQGITSGTSKTTFSPDATCTRGQIVTFLYRAMGQ